MTADHDSRFTVLLKFCDSPQNRQNENRNEAGRPIGKLDPAPHGSSYVVRNGKAYAGAGTSFIKPLAALDDGLEVMIGNAGAVIPTLRRIWRSCSTASILTSPRA